eukprot:m.249570 g.249570  ORF g.249570 m.249570 type:complete len:554 (+) comp17167_c0_seq1:4290-5951(+)
MLKFEVVDTLSRQCRPYFMSAFRLQGKMKMLLLSSLLLLLSSSSLYCLLALIAVVAVKTSTASSFTTDSRPSSANCTEKFFTQTIDHFNWGKPLDVSFTFQQRYFICDQYVDVNNPKTPIFFYFGNEDDVTLYVNNTGLMWENAPTYKALLVFAEHRYYGKSQPFPPNTPGCMNWLTTEQAMADDAILIRELKQSLNLTSSPVVGFGGSYGGMLATYFKRKYPDVVDGVIAGSAPIWSFTGLNPPYDYYGFNNVVADDATSKGGSSDNCKANYKYAQPRIMQLAASEQGRQLLTQQFALCEPIKNADDAYNLIYWTQNAWSYMAMGDYPYPSGYIIHGYGKLPAYPVRVACDYLSDPNLVKDDVKLFSAMRQAMGVYYNYTHTESCFTLYPASSGPARLGHHTQHMLRRPNVGASQCTGDWGYQYCTEMVMPNSQGKDADMFWPAIEFNLSAMAAQCEVQWGVTPRALWAPLNLINKDFADVSNIVFSNGGLDPWSAGGVLTNISDSVFALFIPNGAHHLDLMFSDPADPDDVKVARSFELEQISRWIANHQA